MHRGLQLLVVRLSLISRMHAGHIVCRFIVNYCGVFFIKLSFYYDNYKLSGIFSKWFLYIKFSACPGWIFTARAIVKLLLRHKYIVCCGYSWHGTEYMTCIYLVQLQLFFPALLHKFHRSVCIKHIPFLEKRQNKCLCI